MGFRRTRPRAVCDGLLERDIPFVAFGRSATSGAFPFVDIDHQVVGRAGCARFIALSHRRIALVHAPEHLMFSHLERTGYAEALRAAGIRFDKSLSIEADITEEGGAEAVRRLLKLADPPTAIVCGHDLIALGALRSIAETGKMPGPDVGVIGGDNHPIGRSVHPALTTFSAETHRAGKRMAEMLLQRLEGVPLPFKPCTSRLNCSATADAFAPSHVPKHVEAPKPMTNADRSHQ